MSNTDGSDLTRARNAVDWKTLLQFLAGDYGSFISTDSAYSQSETYHYAKPVIFEAPEPQLSASLYRAEELVAGMPENARKVLLAPIKHGLLDLQSVFHLKDVASDEKITICVEDFLWLVSCYINSVDEEDVSTDTVNIDLSDAASPAQLLSALTLILEGESEYAYAETDSSTRYSNSEVDNDISQISPPPLPETRPPTDYSESTESYKSAHSKCNRKCAVIFSLVLIIFIVIISVSIIAVLYFANQRQVPFDPSTSAISLSTSTISLPRTTISLKFVNKSESFPIYGKDHVRIAFDHGTQMAIVTTVNAPLSTTFASGFSWNGSLGKRFNFTVFGEQFKHCGVHAFYKTDLVYCCCRAAHQYCHAPDKEGIFLNRTLSDQGFMYSTMSNFQFFDTQPTFTFMAQYYPEKFNETYFLLFFYPNDMRLLNYSEVYDTRENIDQWQLLAAPQIRKTPDHSVEMLLKITDNANNTVKHVICNYGLGSINGTLHRNSCMELENLQVHMDRNNMYAAIFNTIIPNGVKLYMVALFTEAPPTNTDIAEQVSPTEEKSSGFDQVPLIVYDMFGRVVASTSFNFQTDEVNVQYVQLYGLLITDQHLFLLIYNSDLSDGHLLQYEFDLPINDTNISHV